MSKQNIEIKKSLILNVIKENIKRFKVQDLKEDLNKLIGDDEADRKIEYPENPSVEMPDDPSVDAKPGEFAGGLDGVELPGEEGAEFDTSKMKSSSELLEFLDNIEKSKSVLLKVAAAETDQEVKNKIYSYYEKAQKLAFEMIKEFGIVH